MARLQQPHAQKRCENAPAGLLLESRMGSNSGELQIRRLGLPRRHSNRHSIRRNRTEIRTSIPSRISSPLPLHPHSTDSFSDSPPRPRLRHLGAIQDPILGNERNTKGQQPPSSRRGIAALRRLSRPRLQIRQPGLLAHALPHRLACLVGTGLADPGTRTRHQPAGCFEESPERDMQDVERVVR